MKKVMMMAMMLVASATAFAGDRAGGLTGGLAGEEPGLERHGFAPERDADRCGVSHFSFLLACLLTYFYF